MTAAAATEPGAGEEFGLVTRPRRSMRDDFTNDLIAALNAKEFRTRYRAVGAARDFSLSRVQARSSIVRVEICRFLSFLSRCPPAKIRAQSEKWRLCLRRGTHTVRAPMIRQASSDAADDQLMALYAGGDFSVFRRLFERLSPWVRSFFRRRFPDRAVADDLTQATFLRLHGARATYQLGRPVRPWLFAIASGVRRDELRRRRRQARSLVDVPLDDHEASDNDQRLPAAGAMEPDYNEAVRAAIRALPESQRAVIQLHQYEELTFEQIAVRLNTTPGAVRVRASRAYERLRYDLRPLLNSLRAK